MDTLPIQLISEILKFLPLNRCLQLGLVSKDLEVTPHLTRKYHHLVVKGKCRLVNDLLYTGPDEDLVSDLVTLSDSLYSRNEEFLWCLVQKAGWCAAWSTTSSAASSAVAWDVSWNAAWSTAAWKAAWSAAREAAKSAVRDAAISTAAWDAAWKAAFNGAWDAVRDTARSAIKRMIDLYRITVPGKISKAAYVCAERWMLINLKVIYHICKVVLDKKNPHHRELRVNLKLTEESPFKQQFQRLFRE